MTSGLLSFGRSGSQKNLQINTFNLQRGNLFPFINQFLQNDRPFHLDYGAPGVDGYTYLDSTGYPTSIPAGGGDFATILAVYLPPLVGGVRDTYTLSWTGAGTLSKGMLYPGFTMSASGTNPCTLTFGIDTRSEERRGPKHVTSR